MNLERVPDLDSLELLLQVASTGSLGRAGAAHGISQPAVTARIRGIEGLVGFPLITRSARGSTLTPAGALIADWAREVLQAAAVLEAGIRSLRSDREERVRIAASMTVAEYLLPRWLVRLASERPETAVSLEAMNSTEVGQVVLGTAAELGFVEGPQIASGLDARVIAHDRLVVVVPPSHPWARRRRPIEAEELAGTRLVHRERASGTRAALEAALADAGPMATPLLELSTTSAVRSAVAAGAGPSVLSNLAVDDDITVGRLVEVAVHGVDLSRQLHAVWPTGQRPSGPARDLLRIAEEVQRSPGLRERDRQRAGTQRGSS
jgi:DNA-binding transcriptional LysR family regulator